jgi:hypothetical protein
MGSAVLFAVLIAFSVFLVRWFRAQSHAADSAVAALHQQMIAGDDTGIYAQADGAYQQTVMQKDSDALFDTIRATLGNPHDSRQIDSRYTDEPSMGRFLTLHYRTVFDKGPGRETICFRTDNGAWKLAAYNVESPLLRPKHSAVILKPAAPRK